MRNLIPDDQQETRSLTGHFNDFDFKKTNIQFMLACPV
jgi:hypothetical protein